MLSRGPAQAGNHVALFHPNPSGLGGSQVSMRTEARGLIACGWQVSIVHGQRDGLDVELGDICDSELFAGALFSTHATVAMRQDLSRLDRWLAAESPDICHVHLWSHPLLVSRLLVRLPTVATAHLPVCPNGARFQYKPERMCQHVVGNYCLTSGYRRGGCATMSDGESFGAVRFALSVGYAKLSLRALARCDRVISPSGWQKEMLVADGVPSGHVVVIAPPIDAEFVWKPDPAAGDPIVLTAGRLSVIKGVHHLLRASTLIAAPHVVHVAGDGPYRAHLLEMVHDLGIAERVRFLGPLSQQEMREAYDRAAVVVVPSLWPETFGMVGPEALLTGTPVVAYLSGGISDWARMSAGVTTVQSGDVSGLAAAIDAVIARDGRSLPVEDGIALSEWLSPYAHAGAVDALYREVIDARAGSATR